MDRKRILNEVKSKGIKTIVPNFFTAFRLVGAVEIPKQFLMGNHINAAILAALCGLSDAADGKVARALDAETTFGAKFDQVVDKIFALGVTFPILTKDPKWAFILLGELAIAKTNIEREMNGEEVKSSIQGKIKTIVLFSAIALNYVVDAFNLNSTEIEILLTAMFGASLAMEIITVASYNKEKNKVLKKSDN